MVGAQVLADFVVIVLGFGAISGLGLLLSRGLGHSIPGVLRPLPLQTSVLALLLLYGVVFTLLGYSEGLYHPETVHSPPQQRLVLAKTALWSTLLAGGLFACSEVHAIPVRVFATAPLDFLFMLGWREQWRRIVPVAHSRRARNVLIVGAGRLGRKLARHLQQDCTRRRVLRGFLDDSKPVGGDIRGRSDDLARIARTDFVDEIILAIPQNHELAQRVIWEARRNRIDVKVVPECFGFDSAQVTWERVGGFPLLTLCEEQIPAFSLLLKRTMDVVFSAAALVVCAPLLATIALAIKFDSKGPVLYRALRLGFKGRRFLCCKFRTMVGEADKLKQSLRERNERQGAFFKINNDPRVTRVGRILRRYSLDELPQLWNVLRGEMSLVGPRPHPLDDAEHYDLNDLQRLEVIPGMTGLWQVTARGDPSFERSMALDREYIGRWTLAMDLRILYRTVAIVLRGEGA